MSVHRLNQRLGLLEALRLQDKGDSPALAEANAALQQLFADFDHDGSARAALDSAGCALGRAVVVCDLAERAPPERLHELLRLARGVNA